MDAQRSRLVSGGRVQVPAEMRRSLGLADGDPVVLRVVEGELRVRPARTALSAIRERLRRHIPEEMVLSDELIADRRAEARGE